MNWSVQVCTSIYFYMFCIIQYKLGCTGMYWYIPANFVIPWKFSYCLVLFWKAVPGDTRQYKAVPESPVPLDIEVQGSTWRYEALYRLVPHYSGVQDFWVLPCIALYRLVPPCIQKRTRRYEKFYGRMKFAGMYQYIPVHPRLYWIMLNM